jgi:hypothetical protein
MALPQKSCPRPYPVDTGCAVYITLKGYSGSRQFQTTPSAQNTARIETGK